MAFSVLCGGPPMMNDESWVDRTLDGRYKVQRILGRGGMGLVLAVRDVETDERFALKIIAEDRAGRTTPERRFLREAEVARRMRSPHVMEVYRVGQLITGERYILMEYLEGKDLGDMVTRRGALPFLEAVQYIIEACAGLGLAHSFGIVHRDIKPSNLFLAQRPNQPAVIKLIDFGISKYLEDEQDLTKTNVFLGSPLYMSPEQISAAKRVDARSDLFSLGVVLYQLITGVTPFAADNVNEVGQRILHATPVPPTEIRPDLPWQIDGIITKCLTKPPEERFQNAAEFSHALEALRPPAAAILERYLDSVDDNEHDPVRPETLSCSFTSSTEALSKESATSIFNRARAIAARGYAGRPLVASPRPADRIQPRQPTFEPATAIPFGVPIPENPYFIGRDAALTALREDLCKREAEQDSDEGHHCREPAVEADVMGPAGIGKTEFMAAYARRYRDAYPGGILWLDESEDLQEQITKQLGGWKPPRHAAGGSTSPLALALLERPRTLVVIETAVKASHPSARRSRGHSFRFEFATSTMSGGRVLATHHIVYISRTEPRSWHARHALGPLDDVNAMASVLLSIGNQTPRSCEPTLWQSARSITRAMHGNPTLLQTSATTLTLQTSVSFEHTLNGMARRLSSFRDKIASGERILIALLGLVSENLSAPAKALLCPLAAFPEARLSSSTLGFLAGMPLADVEEAMIELGKNKLAELQATTQASLATGIAESAPRALGIRATFQRECLGRLADALSNMDVLYRSIELHGCKTVLAELAHLVRTVPTSAPALLTDIKNTLEMAAPCLMSKPERTYDRTRQAIIEIPAKLAAYSLFLAQMRDAAWELGCKTMLERTEAALLERGETWLARRTYHQQAAPRVLGIHDSVVNAVAISADGKRAVSGAEDGSLFLYDVETRSILAEHRTCTKPIRSVAISADGTVVISAAEGSAPEVWNLERRSRMAILEGHHGNVYAVAVSANGRRALTAAEDGLVCAWDVDRCRPLRSLCPYPEYAIWTMFVAAISFDCDGLAIVASPRGTIWYFDVDTGVVVRTVELPKPPLGFDHTPSRMLVYTQKSQDTIRFMDARTGELVGDVEFGAPDYIAMAMLRMGQLSSGSPQLKSVPKHVHVATGGNSCFVASNDRVGRAYSLETGELLHEFVRPWYSAGIPPHNMYGLTGHTGRVTTVASGLDGQTVVTGGADNMVLAWDVAHGPSPRYDEDVSAIAVSPDGKLAISVGGTDHKLVVWDVETATPLRSLPLKATYFSHIVVAGSLVYIFVDNGIRVLDFIHGTTVKSLEMPSGDGTASVECISSDGRRAVLRQGKRFPSTRLFWDIARSTVAPFDAELVHWAVFLDNDRVLLRHGDGKYIIADFNTASIIEYIDGALEGNGPVVATCSNGRIWWRTENGISLVDVDRRSVLKTLPIPTDSGRDGRIAVTPDGRFVATLRDTIQVWSVESKRLIAELKPPFSCGRSVAMTPDGRAIIFAGVPRQTAHRRKGQPIHADRRSI
ncbi:MAG: protein kinase [Polyangiaceae bacterium]|nr:protein kinase [Polyangiaceae bacterium]